MPAASGAARTAVSDRKPQAPSGFGRRGAVCGVAATGGSQRIACIAASGSRPRGAQNAAPMAPRRGSPTRRGSRCRSIGPEAQRGDRWQCAGALAGSGGAGHSAVLPRLDDAPASPSSRRRAACPAALRTRPAGVFQHPARFPGGRRRSSGAPRGKRETARRIAPSRARTRRPRRGAPESARN